MAIDFRQKIDRPEPAQVVLKGDPVERVETYKYLGVLFDSALSWKQNRNAVLKKAHTRLFCLRKLKSFDVKKKPVTGVLLLSSV